MPCSVLLEALIIIFHSNSSSTIPLVTIYHCRHIANCITFFNLGMPHWWNSSADDCALNSNTEAERQRCVIHWSRACDNFGGFTISTKKTESMHPRKMYHEPHIFVNDMPLKYTDFSHTREAPSPEKSSLTWRSISYFPKPTLYLGDSGRNCGKEEESAKVPI